MIKKPLIALGVVGFLIVLLAGCLVSSVQLPAPHAMPFGVIKYSPVVEEVEKAMDLDVRTYSSERALMASAKLGDIYGGYIVGTDADTLVTVPAKSFAGEVLLREEFEKTAEEARQTIVSSAVVPLATSDRTGALVGLLLVPTVVGGYVAASLLYSINRAVAVPERISQVFAYAALSSVLTWLIAGPVLGILPSANLALVAAFFLVASAVGLSAVALQALVGPLGSLAAATLFILLGGAGAGGVGVALLPPFWQTFGSFFPPRHAVELYRNVIYFGGNNVELSTLALVIYVGVSLVVILAISGKSIGRLEPTAIAPVRGRRARRRALLVPAAFAFVLTALFALNYTSSGHEPVAQNMPFGVVGSSGLVEAAQGDLLSLSVTTYSDEQSATDAMDRGEIYGALIASSSPAELVVVPSLSDVAPLDLAHAFESAAAQADEQITVKAYTPTPLAPGDPYALVLATVLVALLVGGYMSASMLATSTGSASARWRGLWLAGFSVVTALVVDLVITFVLQGIPTDAFWVAWAIMSLIIVVVAWFTAVLRRLMGPAGVVVTLIVILQFGNPSSGGSNGATYLPSFWDQIGHIFPPRNDFLLLRNAIYFDGNGIAQPLTVLLVYALLAGGILAYLDWFRSPEPKTPGITDEDAAGAAAVAIPIGPIA